MTKEKPRETKAALSTAKGGTDAKRLPHAARQSCCSSAIRALSSASGAVVRLLRARAVCATVAMLTRRQQASTNCSKGGPPEQTTLGTALQKPGGVEGGGRPDIRAILLALSAISLFVSCLIYVAHCFSPSTKFPAFGPNEADGAHNT